MGLADPADCTSKCLKGVAIKDMKLMGSFALPVSTKTHQVQAAMKHMSG